MTQWSLKVAAFTERNRYDVMLLHERSRAKESFGEMNMTMMFNGGKAMGAPAATIGAAANAASGGVGVYAKTHLRISKFLEDESGAAMKMEAPRWLLARIRLRGVTTTIATVYLLRSHGGSDVNIRLLADLGQAVEAAGGPYLVGGN
jgi:hypothetical protein